MTLGVTPFTPESSSTERRIRLWSSAIGVDFGGQILQFLLGERNTGLLQRSTYTVGQFGWRAVIQVDLAAGVAEIPAGLFDLWRLAFRLSSHP